MKNKLFKATLLVTFLAFSVAWAQHEENDFWYNTRIAVDFGFGLPYGFGLKDTIKDKYKLGNNEAPDFHFSPNIHAGILGSHDFNLTDRFSMGPEIGVYYGFTRRSEIKNRNIAVAEKYLILPLYLRMASYSEPDAFLVSSSFIVGYDFNIFLSSSYNQTGNYADMHPSFQGDKDLYEFIKDLPRVSGSIVLGDELEFPKGFYVAAKFKVPIELFQILQEKDNYSKELNATWVKTTRGLTTNLVEFSVGLDIMRLIQE